MRYLTKIRNRLFGFGLCENVNRTHHSKNALLVYVALPFVSENPDLGHQNQWQAKELAKVLAEFGYNVDVIDFAERVRLKKKYDLVIDVHPGLNSSYVDNMKQGGRRIAYLTGSNPSFANKAEERRLDSLQVRKGKKLEPRRQAQLLEKAELEECDGVLFIGNAYNLRTYEEFDLKKAHCIVNTGYDFLMDTSSDRRSSSSFVFVASGGQVHKGLDLLLDFFVQNPHMELYVCSSYKSERDFCELYHRELFETPNIHPAGFIGIESARFKEICERCSYVLLPSCSEGLAGSVLTGMSAGLIPLVSRECGFQEDEAHFFEDCSSESISKLISRMSEKPPKWIMNESMRVREVVKAKYSGECYVASVRNALADILNDEVLDVEKRQL